MRTLLALALLVFTPVALAAPEQVRLGFATSDPSTTMVVSWLELAAPREGAAVVLESPRGIVSFPAERVLGPSVGVAYEAKLTGLSPATNYSYRIEERAFSFRTSGEGEFSFVALGDMGVSPRAAATVKAVQQMEPDFVLHSGDISYAGGNPTTWTTWFNMVEPVAATTPWITALGNHEADVEGAQDPVFDNALVMPTEIAFYKQRFALPGNELSYSFDWNGAHFVALDTYSELQIPAGEAAWLAADLAANENASWTIVFLHEPPFSSNRHGPSARVQQAFVPIFERFGVDLVLAAHDHGYERFSQRGGVAYVVSGGAGEPLYDAWRSPLQNGSVAHSSSLHVTKVRVTPTTLDVEYVPTAGGTFADNFTLRKSAPASGALPAVDAPNSVPGLGVAVALVAVAISFFGSRLLERGR